MNEVLFKKKSNCKVNITSFILDSTSQPQLPMALFASLPSGEWLIPTKSLLALTPAAFSPMDSLTHAATVTYLPMFLRLFVTPGGYDNVSPRTQLAKHLLQDSLFTRLHNSHVNSLESWPFFAAAMLAGIHSGVDERRLSKIGTLWVALRTAFVAIYGMHVNILPCRISWLL
jgi:uncharacterized MAPEG superfamily protein